MKTSKKVLAILLTIATLIGIFSCATTAFAEEYTEYVDSKLYEEKLLTETFENEKEEAEIIYEVPEKRDEFSKTYKRSDGSFTKVFSKTPLHKLSDGEWEEINNTLKQSGKVISNTDGAFNVEFPKTIDGNEKITVSNEDESISFSVNGIEKANGDIETNETTDEDIIKKDLEKTVSQITYENVDDNTDIQYIVSSTSVKENIIVSNKESLKATYSFDIEKGKLSANLGNKNNLVFKNEKNETVFTIPAPVMTDAAGAVSTDIEVEIKNAENPVLTLIYTPSKEWLESEERVYPVVIDPVIELDSDRESYIEDTMIYHAYDVEENQNTNFSDFPLGIVVNQGSVANNDLLKGEVLVKFNMDAFDAFKASGLTVTGVNYIVTGSVTGGNLLAKPINTPWNSKTITYADAYPENSANPAITYGTEIIDYYTGIVPEEANGESQIINFNITDYFNRWLSGEIENNGFAIVAEDENAIGMFILGGVVESINSGAKTYYDSYIAIDYVDSNGANDSFEYLSQEIGRAGSVNVNIFSRSVSANRSDLSMDGLRMPVDISFVYNSSFDTFWEMYFDLFGADGEEGIEFPYGKNWTPAFFMGVLSLMDKQQQFFTQEGTIVTFNEKTETNENEITEIVFEEDETSDSGYTLELINQEDGVTTENMKITSPNGEEMYLNDSGLVSEIREAEPNANGTYDKISIFYDDELGIYIDYVTDGIGRIYDFIYSSETGYLSEIKCLTADGAPIKAGTTNTDLKVTYGYNNGNLTRVTYPDGETVTYTYDSNGNLVKAENIDGYNIQYTYDSLGKVTNIAEYADTDPGNKIHLTQLGNRQVKVADDFSGTQTYQFGKDGKLHYTFDHRGNYLKSDYAPANDENVYSSYDWSISSQNLLKNGSFEEITNGKSKEWTNSFNVEDIESGEVLTDYACRVSNTQPTTALQSQTVNVDGGKNYTFSLYAKSALSSLTDGDRLYMRITAEDEDGNETSKSRQISPTEKFEQYSITISTETEISAITVEFGLKNKTGDFYVNNAQLEKGYGTAPFNYIKNGSFNNSDDNWSTASTVYEILNSEPVKAVKLTGGLPTYNSSTAEDGSAEELTLVDHISATTQNVEINGKKGETYSIGGWFKGYFDDNYLNPYIKEDYENFAGQLTNSNAQIKVTYSYTDTVTTTDETTNETTTTEQTVTENFVVDFEPYNKGWQYAVDTFALKGDTESVDVTILAKNISADSFATGIEFALDNDAFSFVEEDATEEEEETPPTTNAESTTNTTTESATTENTNSGNTTPEECPCEDCEELDCSCRCDSADVCTCVQCKRQSDIEETSEDGKTITTSSFDGEKYMQSAVTYSNDLNNVISETDENNISSGYAYNVNGGLTSFTDGSGNLTTYQSNAMGYLTLAESNVSGLTDNAVKMAISYVYDGDLLTNVNQGNVQYTYEYDGWGQLKKVLVDGETLVCYNYGDEDSRTRIISILFGDTPEIDFAIEYGYNSDGNIVTVEKHQKIDGVKQSITYTYDYDNLGNLKSITDSETGYFLDYTDEGIVVKDSQTGSVIYQTKDVTPEPETEEEATIEGVSTETDNETPEIVSITQETANGTSYNHKIYESDYNDATGKSTENEAVSVVLSQDENNNFTYGKTLGNQTVSDWFGRNEAVTVMTKDPVDTATTDFASISSQYGYVTNENLTTNLISTVTNTISGEETNTVNYNYTYDSNGRITNASTVSSVPNLSGASQYIYDEAGQLIKEITGSTVYEYAYDSKGNISSRKVYSGETLVSTDTFAYATGSWEDRLTGYNNQSITYDSIGNPTSYLGANLSWRGRELAGYSKGNKQISYSYDVDGMRYRKVVKENDSVKATYDYVYSDGTLILLTYTANGVSNTARFVYDSWGEPRGFMLNDSATYLYLKNAQGDITGIVDENGEIVVRYTYNAWGAVDFVVPFGVDPSASTILATVSPFTYRGYCYDYDIGMYYLQSRYYDPQICRFINADSTDYLGATGTLLSYNLFAYCENDGVNFVDVDGNKKLSTADKLTILGLATHATLTAPLAENILNGLDNTITDYSVYKLKDKKNKKTYKYYSFSLYAYTNKWYKNERYEILSFGATVEAWWYLCDTVEKYLSIKKIVGFIGSSAVATKYLPKLSGIAAKIGVPLAIVCAVVGDVKNNIEKNLKNKSGSEWYQFNWYVKYTYSNLVVKPTTNYLSAYCFVATLT